MKHMASKVLIRKKSSGTKPRSCGSLSGLSGFLFKSTYEVKGELILAYPLLVLRAANMVSEVVTSQVREKVYESLEKLQSEMIAFLQGLVRLQTINPPGQNYVEAAEFIGERLKHFGYQVDYIPAVGLAENTDQHPRINVFGRLQGCFERPSLHFNGHFDVVPVGNGGNVDPFAAEIRDGLIYVRGASDQKAGIAASIYAIEAVRRAGLRLRGTVEQSGTVDEESGGFAGVAYLAQQGWISRDQNNYVIITEPTDATNVCLGHRGVYWFKVLAHGTIAHGSMPYLGISAIDQIGLVLHGIASELKPRLATRKTAVPVQPLMSRYASINVNSIFGGQQETDIQTPCVADRSGAIFDRRFLSEESFEAVKAEIIELLEAQRRANTDFTYTLEDLMVVQPVQTDDQCVLVQALSSFIHEVTGKAAVMAASPGTYDQKHIVRIAGVEQCVAYGPGLLAQAHLPNEHCRIADVVSSARVMALTAIELLGLE